MQKLRPQEAKKNKCTPMERYVEPEELTTPSLILFLTYQNLSGVVNRLMVDFSAYSECKNTGHREEKDKAKTKDKR